MRKHYDDNRILKASHPLDAPDQDFDWKRLYERLKEDADRPDNDRDLAEAIGSLLRILVPYRGGRIRARSIGLRLIALAWVLNPGYFPGDPSLAELARRANITHSKLARYTGYFSRMLNWRNRGQRHAWNWGKGQRPPLGDDDVCTDGRRTGGNGGRQRAGASGGESRPGAKDNVTP